MKALIIFLSVIAIAGCYRNSPAQQVQDAKICIEGGMTPALTGMGEITCLP